MSNCEFFQIPHSRDEQARRDGPPPALFLDRDNTLVKDTGYVHRPADLELLPGVGAALARMHEAGWKIFVVSNQAGVAKGHFTVADAYAFNEALAAEVGRLGVPLDEIRFCPHHPQGTVPEFRQECPSRKPLPGMLESITRAWTVDRGRSVMIGDQDTDVQAGVAAGMRGILGEPGHLDSIVSRVLSADARRQSYREA